MEPQLTYKAENAVLKIEMAGDFCGYEDDDKLPELQSRLTVVQKIDFNAENLGQWDSTLTVILFALASQAKKQNIRIDWSGLPDGLKELIRLASSENVSPPPAVKQKPDFLSAYADFWLSICGSIRKGMWFIGEIAASCGRMFAGAAVMRRIDLLFALDKCGYQAVGIVSVVSFMVGLILAYVGSIQLRNFGAQIYVASLVAIAMTRIMGAIMAGIVMAGRTGASYAAAIGSMQVNEEIDALKTMGISTADFLVLPRLTALIITMPFLTLLSDAVGVLGGMAVGVFALEIPYQEYWKYTYNALSQSNFWLGVFHGFIYGWIIALCGCYYGMNCGRNADSVGVATTKAVVSSIVWMIVITGILTVVIQELKA